MVEVTGKVLARPNTPLRNGQVVFLNLNYMELNKYEKKQKEYIKAQDRLREVEELLRDVPLRPLKEPQQQGWEVTIKLREDIARRQDAPSILKVIELGYHKNYITRSLSDVKAIRKGIKEIPYIDWRGRKGMRSLVPQSKTLNEKQYLALTPDVQKYFYLDTWSEAYTKWGHKSYKFFILDHWIKLKARPNIVTHMRLKGGPLESEREELRTLLQTYWRECGWGGWDRDRWRDGRSKVKQTLKRIIKGEEIETIP